MRASLLISATVLGVLLAAPAHACIPSGDAGAWPCGAATVALGPAPKGRVRGQSDPVARQGHLPAPKASQGPVTSLGAGNIGLAGAAIGPMQCVLDALRSRGYPVRFIRGYGRGSVAGSLHPSGMAMDVNQISRGVTTPRMPSDEISFANSCGVISGAQWADNDSGHFQLGGYDGSARRRGHRHHHRHVRRHGR